MGKSQRRGLCACAYEIKTTEGEKVNDVDFASVCTEESMPERERERWRE